MIGTQLRRFIASVLEPEDPGMLTKAPAALDADAKRGLANFHRSQQSLWKKHELLSKEHLSL